MKYIRFTCEKCGMIINKREYPGRMECPQGHGLMTKKPWQEISFYLTLLLLILFLVSVFMITKTIN